MARGNRCMFGKLLEDYHVKAGFPTGLSLHEELLRQSYDLDNSTLNGYLTGRRRPPMAFLPRVAKCLGLSVEERDALFQAVMIDLIEKFRLRYQMEVTRHEEGTEN